MTIDEREEVFAVMLKLTEALARHVSHVHPDARIVDEARAVMREHDIPQYKCGGWRSRCETLVVAKGALCPGCAARLDTASDHRDFPDRVQA